MEKFNFSDEPIDIQQDFDQWQQPSEFPPPPPAGTYMVYVDQIRDGREFEMKDGRRRIELVMDFRITGGEYDNRTITWQRVSNAEYVRPNSGLRTSAMLDLIKAAGVSRAPNSNAAFEQAVSDMQSKGPASVFCVQIDWRGFCTTCYESSMLQLTGTDSVERAKDVAQPDHYKAANKAATKAKSYRSFPSLPTGGRKDSFICPECKNEIRAQVQIRRFVGIN